MPKIWKKKLLGAKIEATPGTAESLTNTEGAFNVYNIVHAQEIEVEEREATGGFGRRPSVIGGRRGKLSFSIDWEWDGTATEPPWADIFLPSCGWVKSGQVYTPRTEAPGSNVKTVTLGTYIDGLLMLLKGAMGNFTIVGLTGKTAVVNFEYTGVWVTPTDTSILSPTYPTTKPLRYASSTSQWNSVNLCVENMTLNSGNAVTLMECAADESGFSYALVTDRRVTVSSNPESVPVATQDRYGLFLSMDEYALTWSLDGPTNSVCTIAAPKAQIININPGERNGVMIDEIEFGCNRNGSTLDQEASITFTAAS